MHRSILVSLLDTGRWLLNFYQTTRRYNPEDGHLRTNRRENLKSYLLDTASEVARGSKCTKHPLLEMKGRHATQIVNDPKVKFISTR
jgi:hypothetical protein